MGWLFSNDVGTNKAALVRRFRMSAYWRGYGDLLADRVVGNHYWAAVKRLHGERAGEVFIFLALMQSGGRSSGWGYKSMDETVGPSYYDCPLALLNMATDPPYGPYAAEWRQKVRDYHAKRAARPKPVAGLVVEYGGDAYCLTEPAGPRRGWNVTRCRDGLLMRMKAHQLSTALMNT